METPPGVTGVLRACPLIRLNMVFVCLFVLEFCFVIVVYFCACCICVCILLFSYLLLCYAGP